MAGESPDRSKQGKSSGETTRTEGEHEPRDAAAQASDDASGGDEAGAGDEGGAGGAVGARGTDDAEDAVQERAEGALSGSGGSGRSGERGGRDGAGEGASEDSGASGRDAEDQAADSERGSERESESDPESEPQSGPEPESEGEGEGGKPAADHRDARLRDAVAAWVAVADEDTDQDQDKEREQDKGRDLGEGPDSEAPAAKEPSAPIAEPATDLPKRPVARSEPDEEAAGPDEEAAGAPSGKPSPADDEDTGAAEKTPSTDTDERRAEKGRTGARSDAEGGAPEREGRTSTDRPTSALGGLRRMGKKPSAPTEEGDAAKQRDDRRDEPNESNESNEPDEPNAEDSKGEQPEAKDRKPDAKDEKKGPGPASGADQPSQEESGRGDTDDTSPGGSAAGNASGAGVDKDGDGASKPSRTTEDGDGSSGPSRTTEDGDGPSGSTGLRMGSDQPTTAIRAVRRGGGTASESDLERTSRFVPLKSPDSASRTSRSAVGTAEARSRTASGATETADAASESEEPAKDLEEPKDLKAPKTAGGAESTGAPKTKPTTKKAPKSSSAPGTVDALAVPPQPSAAPSLPKDAPPLPKEAPARPKDAPALPEGAPPLPKEAPPRPSSLPALPESERTKRQPLPEYERTLQEPVPDPAPLDLLAELTNTPPPPETLLRTIVRRIKIWTPLVVLVVLVLGTVQALRPLPDPELRLTAHEQYAFDGAKPSIPWPSEGQAYLEVEGLGTLGAHGAQKPVPIASVAKVMTAYIVLRDHPIKKGTDGPSLTIDRQAADDAKKGQDGESVVDAVTGQKISQKEAIEAIMIASANNIARLLARWDAGSEKAFVKKMNDTAQDLGMKNTTYTDPSGLREQTVSTAVDQVKLAKKAMDDPLFREVVRMPSYADSKGRSHFNWNRLVPMGGVVGIKTGTTTLAGGNLLFAAEKEIGGTRQLVVGAVLGQHEAPIIDSVIAASKKLIDAAQGVLMARTVVKKGDVVGEVDDGLGGTTPVVATKDVTAVGWPGLTVDLGITDNGQTIPHEAKPGTKVGTLTVGSGPGQVKVPVALRKDLMEPGLGSKLTRIA